MRFLSSLVVCLPLFIIGCGSDDSSSSSPTGQDASTEATVQDATLDTGPDDAGSDIVSDVQPDVHASDVHTSDAADDVLSVDTGPDAMTEEQAIAAYADALCTMFETCAPFMLGYLYGNTQSCIDRYVAGGRSTLLPNGAGVVRSGADLLQCANAISALSCEALYGGGRDIACPRIAGTLADGDDCFSDLQCASGFCDRHGECGQCAPRIGLGGACEVADNGCDDGLVCHAPTMADPTTCTAGADEDEPCGITSVCRGNLRCLSGTCHQPAGQGEACDGTASSCNTLLGLGCNAGQCVSLGTFADEAEPCGVQNGSYIPCLGSSYCDSTTSVCVAKLDDGALCIEGASNPCRYYASCQNSACTLDAEPTCP